MRPVTHVLLLATSLMGSAAIAETTASMPVNNSQQTSADSWFTSLGITDRALKTRSVDRLEFALGDEPGAAVGESADPGLVDRAFKTRAVQRDHLSGYDDAWVNCLPPLPDASRSLMVTELGNAQGKDLANNRALQQLLPDDFRPFC